MSEYTDVRVTLRNIFTETYQVSFRCLGILFYEVFRSKEEADFWAKKLKTGEWDPTETSPTPALRKQLEEA